jgi:hypothetical protein
MVIVSILAKLLAKFETVKVSYLWLFYIKTQNSDSKLPINLNIGWNIFE